MFSDDFKSAARARSRRQRATGDKTVRNADQILVLESGKISEQGNHAELMRLGGRYASMTHNATKAR